MQQVTPEVKFETLKFLGYFCSVISITFVTARDKMDLFSHR